TRIPGQHVGLTIFLFELTIFWWIVTRLWQRASETVWYERYAAANLAPLGTGPDTLSGSVALPVYAAPSSPEATAVSFTPEPEASQGTAADIPADPASEPQSEQEREDRHGP
ncbi:MAG: hypothetical protein H0X25_19415, partial [Acidobacteriales bacterium]|nr:hypothetical protein [Terriglobales bacterium]